MTTREVQVSGVEMTKLLNWYQRQLEMEVDTVEILAQTPANLMRLTERLDRIRITKGSLEPGQVWYIPVRSRGVPGTIVGTEVVIDEERLTSQGIAIKWI